MKVRRIHPDALEEERRKEILAMTYEERRRRHFELLKKIYPNWTNSGALEGLKVYRKKVE
jgi:hypothetical protein